MLAKDVKPGDVITLRDGVTVIKVADIRVVRGGVRIDWWEKEKSAFQLYTDNEHLDGTFDPLPILLPDPVLPAQPFDTVFYDMVSTQLFEANVKLSLVIDRLDRIAVAVEDAKPIVDPIAPI